jgi:hypothetical protein
MEGDPPAYAFCLAGFIGWHQHAQLIIHCDGFSLTFCPSWPQTTILWSLNCLLIMSSRFQSFLSPPKASLLFDHYQLGGQV